MTHDVHWTEPHFLRMAVMALVLCYTKETHCSVFYEIRDQSRSDLHFLPYSANLVSGFQSRNGWMMMDCCGLATDENSGCQLVI